MSVIECTKTTQCPELEIETRNRLYGSKSTIRDWITEILRLFAGDARRHQLPLNKSQAAKILGISRPTINEYLEIAISHGLCEIDAEGKIKLPEKSKTFGEWSYYEDDAFMQDPLVKEWVENLLVKKDGGKPIKSWRSRYNGLKRMCNTLKIKPAQLIVDKKTYLEILKNLNLGFQQGTLINDKGRKGASGWDTAFHWMKMSSRDFVQFHGISLPKNIGGVASGKVIRHAQYADVRLTDAELDVGDNFIIEKWGLDSDIFRVWGVGIEGGARKLAGLKMELNWETHTNQKTGVVTFIMKAYETKTEGWWKKYIRRPLTKQSLESAKARGQTMLIDLNAKSLQVKEDEISLQLKEIYKFLGKETIHNGYYMRKKFHALRHIASQNQIRWSKGNLTWVCLSVGWKSDLELKASYGELPAELVLAMVDSLGDTS